VCTTNYTDYQITRKLMFHFREIGKPFGCDPTSGIKLLTTGDQRETYFLTSDLTYVKRMTTKQAKRVRHYWNGGKRQGGNQREDDDEWPGDLSESDEEPSEERFI